MEVISIKENNEHLYEMIYSDIIESIKSGKYKVGDQLPTENDLAKNYDVSRITTKKALEMLVDDGYVRRIRGKGSFVTKAIDKTDDEVEQQVHCNNNLIGFILSDYSDVYATDILKGIEDQAFEYGMFVIHKRTQGSQTMEQEVIKSFVELGVCGIIIMPVHGEHYNPSILRLVLDGFPVVFVDRYLKGIPSSFVVTNNVESTKEAMRYLISKGYIEFCFVTPPLVDTSTLEDRYKGFQESLVNQGIDYDKNINILSVKSSMPGNDSKESKDFDVEAIAKHLMENPQITCMFASEYNIALLVLKAANKCKKRVPEDISIICYDEPQNYIEDYSFTHIEQKETEMGKIAVDIIYNKEKNKEIYLKTRLIIGRTTK